LPTEKEKKLTEKAQCFEFIQGEGLDIAARKGGLIQVEQVPPEERGRPWGVLSMGTLRFLRKETYRPKREGGGFLGTRKKKNTSFLKKKGGFPSYRPGREGKKKFVRLRERLNTSSAS